MKLYVETEIDFECMDDVLFQVYLTSTGINFIRNDSI